MNELYRNRLRIRRNICTEKWNWEYVRKSLNGIQRLENDEKSRREALDDILLCLNRNTDARVANTTLAYDIIGDTTIINSRRMRSLICHRSDEHMLPEQAMRTLDAAAEGDVIVSAFISKNEKIIKDMLMRRGLPVIEVTTYPFAPGYTPRGMAYDAVVEGKMAQASPWGIQMPKKEILTREMCKVANAFVRVLSWCDDDWWTK